MKRVPLSRRSFLKRSLAATAAIGAPAIIPSRALGLDGATAPSNRITIGFIGLGKMNKGHVQAFLNDRSCQVVAMCDVEKGRREGQAALTNEFYGRRDGTAPYKDCAVFSDYRELCADKSIDGVVIATPNQWHALNAVEAAMQGKDIYLEKPMARTVAEGQAIVKAVRRYGRILQVGSQQRSDSTFLFACEMVRNGRIGKVHTIHVNVGGPPEEDYLPAEETPEGLDWDMWLGPCPMRPYSSTLAPPESFGGWPEWRYYRPYAGGMMTDFGAHHFDIAQWAIGMDGSGPVEIYPPDGETYTTLTYKYADGTVMYHGGGKPGSAVEWIGDEGRVRVNRGQYLETEPDALKLERIGASDIRLYNSPDHRRNWLEAMRTRKDPICTAEIGQSTGVVCHIGNIAYWLKRPLKWDPDNERFVGDEEANRLLSRPMREPWNLPLV